VSGASCWNAPVFVDGGPTRVDGNGGRDRAHGTFGTVRDALPLACGALWGGDAVLAWCVGFQRSIVAMGRGPLPENRELPAMNDAHG